MTFWTPGCAGSVVLKTCLHSCSLSMVYFSVTFMVAIDVPVSVSHRATSSPTVIASASSLVGRQGDRDGPEQAVLRRHRVLVADPLPVRLAHEPVEGGEAADAHHDEVAGLAAGDRDLLEAGGLLDLGLARRAFQQQGLQFRASVRGNQFAHAVPPWRRASLTFRLAAVPGSSR